MRCRDVVCVLVEELEGAAHKKELMGIFELAESDQTGQLADFGRVCVCTG